MHMNACMSEVVRFVGLGWLCILGTGLGTGPSELGVTTVNKFCPSTGPKPTDTSHWKRALTGI